MTIVVYVLGGIVLLVAIAVVAVSLQRNQQGEEDDPLQARLAEFIQRGDVASLEEIELSQPFAQRVIIPIMNRIGEFSARFTPQKTIQNTARRFELAGNPWPIDPPTFLLLRLVSGVIFCAVMIAVTYLYPLSDKALNNFFYIFVGAFFGFWYPD